MVYSNSTNAGNRSHCHSPLNLSLLNLIFLSITFAAFYNLHPVAVDAFSSPAPLHSPSPFTNISPNNEYSNILILDHLNINHQKGRHDLLKAFYFDFLECIVDERKIANYESGSKTLWANIGAHQFHLPEGKPDAQVLEGMITLVYPNVGDLVRKLEENEDGIYDILLNEEISQFSLTSTQQQGENNELLVIDPWGTRFKIIQPPASASSEEDKDNDINTKSTFTTPALVNVPSHKDERGLQKGGESSLGLSLQDITLYTPKDANLHGIARFYHQLFNAPILHCDNKACIVSVGPYQTLSFVTHPDGKDIVQHEDLRMEEEQNVNGEKDQDLPASFPSNYGPHISIYVQDLRSTYRRVDELGLAYVNPRFSRRAYDEEGAVDDCMFRCLDIVDPAQDVQAGEERDIILKVEHEVRSVMKRDGRLYKSCPFNEIPDGCVI